METIDGHFTDDDAPKAMPNQIDVHVGCCVWQRRNLLGLSEEKLGEALGLIFKQLQKYERSAAYCKTSGLAIRKCLFELVRSLSC